jgi:hypothetical protein
MKRERQPQSNFILWNIDNVKIKCSKKNSLDPNLLLTENRQDINLRITFLEDIFQKNLKSENTKYFKFISDKDKGIRRDSKKSTENFRELIISIKEHNILEPILVGKYVKKKIQTRYIINNTKKWFEVENKTGFQLIDGAHRLSIALFLKFKTIPVKIIEPVGFEIPNYSEYIKHKEKEYL